MQRHIYFSVEGVIGVGKTTLARLSKSEFDAELLLEAFEENPFLARFYEDRKRYGLQTQLFFLLSRYRQQHEAIPAALHRCNLISDYIFDKNRIFARLNIEGDELRMYEQIHSVIATKIPIPDLVVYLRADTDVLMERIASRDRSYERCIDRSYIESLARAYDEFFADYVAAPVLVLDTTNLNIVRDPRHRTYVIDRIKSAIGASAQSRESGQIVRYLCRSAASAGILWRASRHAMQLIPHKPRMGPGDH